MARLPEQSETPDAESVIMLFGKYKGKTLGWIAENDLLYIDWLTDADIRSDDLADAVAQVAELYSAAIDAAVNERD